jgi:uncharacterized protein YgiM (DUF1202 family)
MNRLILTVLTTIAIGFSAIVSATETSTVVVYRDVSKLNVSFAVFANSSKIGRLKEGKAISMDVPAGEIVISSSVRGGEPLTVNAKAGETIYIDGELIKKRSGKFMTTFTLTDEKVALSSKSSLNTAI